MSAMHPGTAAQVNRADEIEAMAWGALFDAMPAPMRAHTGARVEYVHDATLLLTPGIPIAFFNRAMGLGSREPVTAAAIGSVVDAFKTAGVKSFMVHSDHTTQCKGVLSRMFDSAGLVPFAARPAWSKFLRDGQPAPNAETSLSLREATSEDASALASALVAAHDLPKEMEAWIRAMVGHPHLRCYALADGPHIVGGGVLFVKDTCAWLGLGGTLVSHRRRGGQKAVMARRIADAIALGARDIATETGEPRGEEPNPSWSNMHKSGFQIVSSRKNWVTRA